MAQAFCHFLEGAVEAALLRALDIESVAQRIRQRGIALA
ncbi:hypothetical protein M2322_004250 [Rhodoblastus acidophilus]|nr:hypothetical protein [Rhodoblastus acidophilus]